MKQSLLIKFLILIFNLLFVNASWQNWWTYDGISGPDFWALNPSWTMCSKGRKQSPIDINTNKLLFDPGLKPIQFNGDSVEGNLENTGRGLRFNLHNNNTRKFLVFNGPLAYEYRLSHLILHFGRENDRGSEHTINGIRFVGELQLYFFNHILYENYSESETQPNGLAVISILIQLIENQDNQNRKNATCNEELSKLLDTMDQIKYKGTAQISHSLNVTSLLPRTQFFLTYEGSLTEPPCLETSKWIILNRPIYTMEKNLFSLRNSIVIDGYGDNFRPLQPLNARPILTNIINNINNLDDKQSKLEQNEEIKNQIRNQLGNLTNQDKDEFNGLKKFCTTNNNVYGYYTYRANIKQDNNLT